VGGLSIKYAECQHQRMVRAWTHRNGDSGWSIGLGLRGDVTLRPATGGSQGELSFGQFRGVEDGEWWLSRGAHVNGRARHAVPLRTAKSAGALRRDP
jgi:hypothetical protein